jgi:hypothetical protein
MPAQLIIPASAGQTNRCCDELAIDGYADEITLDLSRVSFVAPLFLVRLRAWLDFHGHHGVPVTVVPPDMREVANYMSRMHVAHDLYDCIDFPLRAVRERRRSDRLIAVTRLDAPGATNFDDEIGELLDADDMSGASYLAEVVEQTAAEMTLNATEHGGNEVGLYVAAQKFMYRNSSAPLQCVLAVGDLGVGMAHHLRDGGHDASNDGALIALGMTEGVSGTGEYGRGRGYEVPFEVAKQKEAASTVLRVRANDGWATRRNMGKPRVLADNRAATSPGTWVEFRFAHAGRG